MKENNWLTFIIFLTCLLCLFINNLLILFLLLELQTFCILIILGGINDKNFITKSTESSLKYLILSGLTSIFFLLGIFFIQYGDIVFFINNQSIIPSFYGNLTSLFIIISLVFKFGMVPFHFWLLDIYESCSWTILSVVVTIPKLTYLIILFRLNTSNSLIIILGLMNLAIGALGALNQVKIKRLLGYSSINQSGFIILCLLLPKEVDFNIAILYVFVYFCSLLILMILLMNSKIEDNIFEISKISLINKLLTAIIIINLFSLAGFPPFSGFLTKWIIILKFIQLNYNIVAFSLVLFSIISLGYYLNLIKISYFEYKKNFYTWTTIRKHRKTSNSNILHYFLTYFVVFLFINPDLLFSFL